MLEEFPEVAGGHHGSGARTPRKWIWSFSAACSRLPSPSFLEQELMQGQNLLLLDLNKCTRCDECVKACVATHDDGVTRLVRDGLRFENFLVATSCRACMDPLCMTRCPVGSIRRKDTLDIVIEDWCIGCGNCAIDCPYGNINVVEVTDPHRASRRPSRVPRPWSAICAPSFRSPTACAPVRTMRPSAWSPRRFFARDLAGMQLAVPGAGRAAAAAGAGAAGRTSKPRSIPTWAKLLDMLPRLKIISGPRAGSFLQLRYPSTTFGRGADNDYRFADDTVMSRAQAVIVCEGSRFILRDLNSTNGTLVNGNPVIEIDLHPGDIIEMGEMQMEFMGGQVQ